MRLETRAVRGGRDGAHESMAEGVSPHVPGIDLSTTYGFDSSAQVAESMDSLLEGSARAENPVYARLHNPTVAAFEDALAGLEHADGAIAFASGMAAIVATIQAASGGDPETGRPARRHVVAVRPLYGGTDHLLTSGLLGTEVTWANASDVADALRPDTGLVFVETPANPTLRLTDIRALVSQVREGPAGHSVPVAVDSTFATPVLQTPLTLGADMVVHSATKFLGGHGDVMGGVVATSDYWARRLRQVRMVTGAVLHPLAGYLLHRGLQTLPVRVRAQQESARELAARLSTHPGVGEVLFPGISGDPRERRLLASQQRGPGSVLSFRVRGGVTSARRVVESLRLITRAVSLGSVDTLIQAPALLTHRVVDPGDRVGSGIPDDLLRLSVGLESVDDLWADLDQAMGQADRSAA